MNHSDIIFTRGAKKSKVVASNMVANIKMISVGTGIIFLIAIFYGILAKIPVGNPMEIILFFIKYVLYGTLSVEVIVLLSVFFDGAESCVVEMILKTCSIAAVYRLKEKASILPVYAVIGSGYGQADNELQIIYLVVLLMVIGFAIVVCLKKVDLYRIRRR